VQIWADIFTDTERQRERERERRREREGERVIETQRHTNEPMNTFLMGTAALYRVCSTGLR